MKPIRGQFGGGVEERKVDRQRGAREILQVFQAIVNLFIVRGV